MIKNFKSYEPSLLKCIFGSAGQFKFGQFKFQQFKFLEKFQKGTIQKLFIFVLIKKYILRS